MLEAPLLALHLPKSRTKAITRVPQFATYVVREKGMQMRTKVSFGRTMMQTLELLRLVKRHTSRRSDVEQ